MWDDASLMRDHNYQVVSGNGTTVGYEPSAWVEPHEEGKENAASKGYCPGWSEYVCPLYRYHAVPGLGR